MFKTYWDASKNIYNRYVLDSEHNWEDIHIQLRNQQTLTSDNHI